MTHDDISTTAGPENSDRYEGLSRIQREVSAPDVGMAVLAAHREAGGVSPIAVDVEPVQRTYTGTQPRWDVTFWVAPEKEQANA